MGGFGVYADALFNTSVGFTGLKERLQAITNGLTGDLNTHSVNMTGPDDAGRIFTQLYEPAARETVNKLAFSTYVMSGTARGLLASAFNYLAADDAAAARLMKENPPDIDSVRATDDCDPTGADQHLPEVMEKEGWVERHLQIGPKGDTGKATETAGTWRQAAKLVADVVAEAQTGVRTMLGKWDGEAFDGFDAYFNSFISWKSPPSEPTVGESLICNLVGACSQIAVACDAYSEHLAAAQAKWAAPNPFNAFRDIDAEMADEVAKDTRIRKLAELPGILDGSGKRIKIPEPKQATPGIPGIPGLPVPRPVPVPLVPAGFTESGELGGTDLATANPVALALAGLPTAPPPWDGTYSPPVGPPTPPLFPLLNGKGQQQFRDWAEGLHKHGPAGGNAADIAYQRRVAGHPEYDLPLPNGRVIQADGLRSQDGDHRGQERPRPGLFTSDPR